VTFRRDVGCIQKARKTTEQISAQIPGIQASTSETADTIKEIITTIGGVRNCSGSCCLD
jgi:hypothetical protein